MPGGRKAPAVGFVDYACDPDDLEPIDIPSLPRAAATTGTALAQLVRALAAEARSAGGPGGLP